MSKYLLIFLFICPSVTFSSTNYGYITPQFPAQSTALYNMPGFNFWTCQLFPGCMNIASLQRGDRVKVVGSTRVRRLSKHRSTYDKYFKVSVPPKETAKTKIPGPVKITEPTVGYISADLVSTDTEPENCDEQTDYLSAVINSYTNIDELIAKAQLDGSIKNYSNRNIFSPMCLNFLDLDGKIGPWGKQLLNAFQTVDQAYIKETGRSCFYNDMDMSDVCPNFKKFDQERKALFWTYSMAALTQDEASCDPSAQGQGPNGIADGLLQLEHDASLRKDSNRDPKYCPHKSINSQNLSFQFACSASIFLNQNCRAKQCSDSDLPCIKRRRKINNPAGYWQELRGSNAKVSNRLKVFPGCS